MRSNRRYWKKNYTLPDDLKLNTFALGGTWKYENEKVVLTKPNGTIKLHFSSGKVHMVAESAKPNTIKIVVDGTEQKSVTVKDSELYTLFDSNEYKDHVIEIQIPDAGFEAFTFTFG